MEGGLSRRRLGLLGGLLLALVPLGASHAGGGRCVIFFEGNDCTQSRSSCCTIAAGKMSGCWKNDEARSMKVFGPPGMVITVFDSPSAETSDDYFVFEKRRPGPACVGSFETASETLKKSGHRWFYSGHNGLDGKVSTLRWFDPRTRQ